MIKEAGEEGYTGTIISKDRKSLIGTYFLKNYWPDKLTSWDEFWPDTYTQTKKKMGYVCLVWSGPTSMFRTKRRGGLYEYSEEKRSLYEYSGQVPISASIDPRLTSNDANMRKLVFTPDDRFLFQKYPCSLFSFLICCIACVHYHVHCLNCIDDVVCCDSKRLPIHIHSKLVSAIVVIYAYMPLQ